MFSNILQNVLFQAEKDLLITNHGAKNLHREVKIQNFTIDIAQHRLSIKLQLEA